MRLRASLGRVREVAEVAVIAQSVDDGWKFINISYFIHKIFLTQLSNL